MSQPWTRGPSSSTRPTTTASMRQALNLTTTWSLASQHLWIELSISFMDTLHVAPCFIHLTCILKETKRTIIRYKLTYVNVDLALIYIVMKIGPFYPTLITIWYIYKIYIYVYITILLCWSYWKLLWIIIIFTLHNKIQSPWFYIFILFLLCFLGIK